MRRKVQRLVRTYIIGCLAAHSQDPNRSFPAAESGRISGQAASSYILCERRCSPSGHLVTRRVEHIVGFHFHWLFCPDPVPNRGRAVDAVSVEGRGRSISRAATQYFLNPTSAFTVAPLVARKVERLVGSHFHWLFLASLFQIVSAGFVTFVYQWWRVRRARGCLYIS